MTILFRSRGSSAESWDPRAKLLFVLFLSLDLIIDHRPVWMGVRLLLLLVLWAVSRLPWQALGRMMLSLGLLFASTLIFHSVTGAGAAKGLIMCLQIIGLVILLSFLVHTTPPLVLAEGMELLLSPLKRLRVPVHALVMIFAIALRFLPILVTEFDKVRKAQIARGAGFHRRSLPHRVRGVMPMLVPVFIQALLRAEELATAMDARCYRGDVGRTPLRLYRMGTWDWTVTGAAAVVLLSGIVHRI